MDYEKLHKDTIYRLQQMVSCGKITVEVARGICADFIPESDDEKTRKEIIFWIKGTMGSTIATNRDKWIDWLEKQGEKKPAEWSEKDELQMQGIIDLLPGLTNRHRWLKALKDRVQPLQWKPSEKQMNALANACNGNLYLDYLNSLYQDLKKL